MDPNKPTAKPSRPADWDLTIDDLMTEMHDGTRASIEQPYLDWAREYEISTIPAEYRFPKTGDLYESIMDQEINFMTAWAAPFTGGGKGTILKGERIWIPDQTEEKCIGTYPIDYARLEERMVHETDRLEEKYEAIVFSSLVTKGMSHFTFMLNLERGMQSFGLNQ
ncbi:MAG: hypothetical protein ABI002_01080 [Saprospiraceae bacterium]